MAKVILFETSESPDKPLSFRDFWKANKAAKAPIRSHVRVVFPPGKFNQWSLITDHNFVVRVYDNNPSFNSMGALIEAHRKDSSVLYVFPLWESKEPKWALGTDTDQVIEWKRFDWGFLCSFGETKPDTKKPQSKTAR